MSCSHTQPAPGRTAVISDTHFGEAGALLASPEYLERLFAQLEGAGEADTGAPVSRVVLLGDIWDLWRTDLSTAVRASRPFFEALSCLPGLTSLLLVFGNHDYHLYFNLAESRALREAGEAGEAGKNGRARRASSTPAWRKTPATCATSSACPTASSSPLSTPSTSWTGTAAR